MFSCYKKENSFRLANLMRSIADDDIVNFWLVTIFFIETLLGILNEFTIQVIANEIDGAASKATAHDT